MSFYRNKFVVGELKYHLTMKCNYCAKNCIRKGRQKNGTQKYFCRLCNKYQQLIYRNQACAFDTNERIISLVKESCGTRSISRILNISPNTVTKRIKRIGKAIDQPLVVKGQTHEMDELITYAGKKENRICIAYAIDRKTKEVVNFGVGRRNKRTLSYVVNTLLLSESKQIRTDKLNLYIGLIPKEIHHIKQRGINRIERKNLNLRTHIKRLNRRTIAFTRSISVLTAILKIYFWG